MPTRRTLLAAALLAPAMASPARAQTRTVRIGQASDAVSFLPLAAARALNSFEPQGLDLAWADTGGDPACLAALDSGDIDLAAVGAETLLDAVGKGQPFQMAFALMSKAALQLVVSNAVIERTGVSPEDDPLPKRLETLKGVTVGVSASGGTQDRAARWLARQAGLDPRTDVHIVQIGPPSAIQAALDAGRIDGYVLSPPAGLITEDARTGRVLVRMGDEFPELEKLPSLVLAAKTPVSDARRDVLVKTCKSLQDACAEVLANPAKAAGRIQAALYPKLKPEVMQSAVLSLKSGIQPRGRFDPAGINDLIAFAGDAAKGADPAEGKLWTNAYWSEAAK